MLLSILKGTSKIHFPANGCDFFRGSLYIKSKKFKSKTTLLKSKSLAACGTLTFLH